MSNILEKLQSNKRIMFLSVMSIIVLFCVVLNVTFSAFTTGAKKQVANITVGELSYTTNLENNIMSAPSEKVTRKNIMITSNNSIDTKYEVTFEVCTDSSCNNKVSKPSGLSVEYSSKTTSPVSGTINSLDSKIVRLIVTNNTSTNYYIRIGINAGFSYLALNLKGQITDEFAEDDLIVQTFKDGVKQNSFPNTSNFYAKVACYDNDENLLEGTTGTIKWSNNKWNLTINNFDTFETICKVNFYTNPEKACTYEGTLQNGDTYVNGQYTYTFDSTLDGWKVALTDKSSTAPVTSEICSSINDKLLVSTSSMFGTAQTTSVNLSSLNTANLVDMSGMFYGSKIATVDLSNRDMSKVTNMGGLFSGSATTSVDLSGSDMSNVTSMSGMFAGSAVTTINLSGVIANSIEDMNGMFYGSKVNSLDLSGFNTSNVTIMGGMFSNMPNLQTIDLSNFDTSSVTNMEGMFRNSIITTLDLSSFDTSNVTNMNDMFNGSAATTGYARTQADADRLNASSNKPSGLTFVLKS